MEDFGQGMIGALACISVDLAVVASGVKAAAEAFSSLETALKNTLAQLDAQIGYVTSTTSSVALYTPSAADNAALGSFAVDPSSSGPGFSWTVPHVSVQPTTVGVLGVIAIVGLIIILSPVGA